MGTAFKKYLLRDKQEGCQHILDCLRSGGEMAWEIMEIYNGPKWSVAPAELPALIGETWEKLKANPERELPEEDEE